MDQADQEKNSHLQGVGARKHSHDADDAMLAFAGIDRESVVVDEATNKRLRRTLDWHLMPLMSIVFMVQSLDSMYLTPSPSRQPLVRDMKVISGLISV